MKNSTVSCYNLDDCLGKTDEPTSHTGTVTISWLLQMAARNLLNTSSREYQREKVAELSWKQALMETILCHPYAKVPQIHIRVTKIEVPNEPITFKFELVDGQQRVTSILDFIDGLYSLAGNETKDLQTADKKLIGGYNMNQLRNYAPSVCQKLENYEISCLWYENLTDQQVSELFVNVLNNTNDLKPQEIRNAIRGQLSTFVRDTARPLPNAKSHKLFERNSIPNGHGKPKEKLVNLEKLALDGRMEADEWFLSLIYMCEYGLSGGITSQKALTDWVTKSQNTNGFACVGNSEFSAYRKRWLKLADYTLEMIKAVPKDHLSKLTPLVAQFLTLYAWEVENRGTDGRLQIVDKKKFASMFFEVYAKWNDIQVYGNHKQANNAKDMQPFKDLFGGKNPNAMQTIRWVLNRERGIDEKKVDPAGIMLQGPLGDLAKEKYDAWGIIEMDPRVSFNDSDIIRKWKEQDKKCFYTGRPLEEDELVGDHYIPRSYGVDAGGVTEYHNLVVTDKIINGRKLSIHGDDFIRNNGYNVKFLKESQA